MKGGLHLLAGIALVFFISACVTQQQKSSSSTSTSTKSVAKADGKQLEEKDNFLVPDSVPAPADNQLTPARVELGKSLFFDPRLSGSNWISCATCHNPTLGWSDGLPKGIGNGMATLPRATPTIINTAYQRHQMWDGRARTLEEQAHGPMANSAEMNQNPDELIAELKAVPGYVKMFKKAYPGEGITMKTVTKAIASFERTIVSNDTPFDRWQRGDETAVSEEVKRGFELFKGKANCVACHHGFNFEDDGFHNIGLKDTDDLGRYKLKPVRVLKGAMKTPTLRQVSKTAPYMHNGLYKTLEEVVEHYDRGGDVKSNLDPNMKPLKLTKQEKKDLVSFLMSLTDDTLEFTLPVLP